MAIDDAKVSMHARLSQYSPSSSFRLQVSSKAQELGASSTTLQKLIQRFTSLATFKHAKTLLHIFVVHCAILPRLSVQERARPCEALHPDLVEVVGKHFLPLMFGIAADFLGFRESSIEFDGRIFVALIRFCISNPRVEMRTIIGPSIYQASVGVLSLPDLAELDLVSFANRFPNGPDCITLTQYGEPTELLPFDNAVFSSAFSPLNFAMGKEQDLPASFKEHLFFGQGATVEDKTHWHNGKSILPPHQGGERPKQTNEKARLRELRSHQRFMSSLQIQAATLTGASGGSLKQIIIPPVGTGKIAQSHSTTTKVSYLKRTRYNIH